MKGTFQTDNEDINGYEEFNKKSGRVNLTYGVGGRFLLTIKADKQESSEWAKDLAEGMELDELASK